MIYLYQTYDKQQKQWETSTLIYTDLWTAQKHIQSLYYERLLNWTNGIEASKRWWETILPNVFNSRIRLIEADIYGRLDEGDIELLKIGGHL